MTAPTPQQREQARKWRIENSEHGFAEHVCRIDISGEQFDAALAAYRAPLEQAAKKLIENSGMSDYDEARIVNAEDLLALHALTTPATPPNEGDAK